MKWYIVGGDEKIARSTNGGLSWTTIYTGIFQYVFLGVDFFDEDHGIVGGEDGKVLRTSNGGQTWQTSYVPGNPLLRAAYMHDSLNATIAGTPEAIYTTSDGGATWASDYTGGFTYAIYDADFTANGTGFICGSQGRIWKKTAPIVADFSASSTFSCAPDSFYFTDQSTGPIDIWLWNFPGGNPSFQNGQTPPGIYYGAPGSYDVQLTIISGSQSDTLEFTNYLEIEAPHSFQVSGMSSIDIAANNGATYTTDSIAGYSYLWYISPMAALGTPTSFETWVQFQDTGSYQLWVETESPSGCKDSSAVYNIVVTNTISISESENSIVMFPNPVLDVLQILWTNHQEYEFRVFNPTGQVVKKGTSNGRIDFSDLAKGVYVVELSNNGEAMRQMVIKQ